MEDNALGYYRESVRIKPNAMPPDGINKIAYYDDDYETVTEFIPFSEEDLAMMIRPTDSTKERLDAIQKTQEELVLVVADIIGGGTVDAN